MIEVKNPSEVKNQGQVVFGPVSTLGHEQVVFCHDAATGLRAIIGVHNTTLGPALGGTRMWMYDSDLDALNDVLRLSRGMTYKASMAGLNLGGGKAVIIGNSRTMKNEAYMRRFGKFVDNLGGKYITAEDVGTSTRDMEWIKMETDHVTGIPVSMGGSGDPSPVTAYGVYLGIKASLKKLTGSENLAGKKVIVQGTGNVGYYLCELLRKEHAKLYVFDIFEDKLKKVVEEFDADVITEDQVYSMHADVFAPCALGAILNKDTIPQLNVPIVCGGANNQLQDEMEDGKLIREKGILWGPDFVVNAGGLCNVYTELEGYTKERAYAKADKIYENTLLCYQVAEEQNITTSQASIQLAEQRIREVGNLNLYL
jgi:leucine dehydrogenase